jgi:tetratricopeptide (TPR) repeat protein
LAEDAPNVSLGEVKWRNLPIELKIPACARCRKHENLKVGAIAAYGWAAIFAVFLVIGLIAGSQVNWTLFLVFLALGIVCAVVARLLQAAGNEAQRRTCAPFLKTLELEPGIKLFGWIHFGNAEYGEAFALANGPAQRGTEPAYASSAVAPRVAARSDAEQLFHVGKAAFQWQQWEYARTALARAAELAPDSAATRFLLGASLTELARPEGALPHLDRSVALDSKNADVFNTLGMVLGRLGRMDKADRHLARAAFMGHPQARETLANMKLGYCPACGALLPSPGGACAACGAATPSPDATISFPCSGPSSHGRRSGRAGARQRDRTCQPTTSHIENDRTHIGKDRK